MDFESGVDLLDETLKIGKYDSANKLSGINPV